MLQIDLKSSTPIEEQIRRGIRAAIARGKIAEGDSLPSSRQLAGDLGINFNTVARAYRTLRDEGLLTVERGRNAIAHRAVKDAGSEAAGRRVVEHVADALTEARLNGLSWSKIEVIFQNTFDQWKHKGAG